MASKRLAYRFVIATLAVGVLGAPSTGCVKKTKMRPRPKWVDEPQPVLEPAVVRAPVRPTRQPTAAELALDALATEVGAHAAPVENPCVEGSESNCFRRALDRVFVRLDTLVDAPRRNVRILQLGDSHIAADYITKTVRDRLQLEFGDAGRGYVHVEQRAQYGGRKLSRKGSWERARAVDKGQSGAPFGFSGMAIEAKSDGARIDFRLRDEDSVTVYFLANLFGGEFKVYADRELIGQVDTQDGGEISDYKTFTLPPRKSRGKRRLRIVAEKGVRLFGLSFQTNDVGLIYDAVGPVGADANVYLSLDRDSFAEHLSVMAPDLVIIMLGGNDGLRIRRGQATVEDVGKEFERLVDIVQDALPDSDCMLWSPMDAGGGPAAPS